MEEIANPTRHSFDIVWNIGTGRYYSQTSNIRGTWEEYVLGEKPRIIEVHG